LGGEGGYAAKAKAEAKGEGKAKAKAEAEAEEIMNVTDRHDMRLGTEIFQ